MSLAHLLVYKLAHNSGIVNSLAGGTSAGKALGMGGPGCFSVAYQDRPTCLIRAERTPGEVAVSGVNSWNPIANSGVGAKKPRGVVPSKTFYIAGERL